MKFLEYLCTCDISVLDYLYLDEPLIKKQHRIMRYQYAVLDCNIIVSKRNISVLDTDFAGDVQLKIEPNSEKIVINNSVLNINTTDDELFQLELTKPEIVQYFNLMKKIHSRGVELNLTYEPDSIDYIIKELEYDTNYKQNTDYQL